MKNQTETKRIRKLNRVELIALWIDATGCTATDCGSCTMCDTTPIETMLAQVLHE